MQSKSVTAFVREGMALLPSMGYPKGRKQPFFPLQILTDLKAAAQSAPKNSSALLQQKTINKAGFLKDDNTVIPGIVKTKHRAATIIAPMVGHQIAIHNGHAYVPVFNYLMGNDIVFL